MSTRLLIDAWLASNQQAKHLFANWQDASQRRGRSSLAATQLRMSWLEARNRTLRLQKAILARARKG